MPSTPAERPRPPEPFRSASRPSAQPFDDPELFKVLASLRDYGALGEASLPQAVEHAEAFVAALPHPCSRLIDLGSGGGLPGLVLAMRLEDCQITLTDRRERRADLLSRACHRLGIDHRVEVIVGDVVDLGKQARYQGSFDAVSARSFGPPLHTLRCAAPFLSSDGVVVISEPPGEADQTRWPAEQLREVGFHVGDQLFPRVKQLRFRGGGAAHPA